MDKKKVGELEGTPIVIGKKNYANEHEYYLTMNEDNTYKKLEQRVSGDKFRLVLGGGSDYPTPTAGDVNKVWQVTPVQKGTKSEETVIVPEQTLVNGQELEYNDKFVPGAQCVAVINGVEYRGKIINQDDFYIFSGEFGRFEYESKEELFFFYSETEYPEEATVSLSVIEEVPDYDYNWAPGVKIPIPTAEDEGKVLAVNKVEGDSKEYELVPTQTVQASRDGVILQNTSNLDKFAVGATVISVLNGTAYTEQVINDGGLLCVTIDGNCSLNLVENGGEAVLIFDGGSAGYEISASILAKEYSYEYQLQENSGSGSGSGSDNDYSIPTIDQNIQPNIVWREPTEEDLAKFNTLSITSVADLSNGKVPLFAIIPDNVDDRHFDVYHLTYINTPIQGSDGYVQYQYGEEQVEAAISKDWTLLGIYHGAS